MRTWLVPVLAVAAASASAKIVTKTVLYQSNGVVCEGFMAYDDAKGKRPCVLIVHDWDGLGDYEKMRAKQVAALGYTAMAVDMYGRGLRPKPPKESAEVSSKFGNDRLLTRRRIGAAIRFAMNQPQVDRNRIAVMGYCFGGMVALEAGRAGNPLRGFISFHGNLSNPMPADARNIKGEVLILHGAADPLVPKAQVAAFEKEMKAANKPYKLVAFPGALHSFTVKGSEKAGIPGVGYQAAADKKSWAELTAFLKRAFK